MSTDLSVAMFFYPDGGRDEGNRRNDRKDSGDEITFIPEFFPSFVFFAL